MASPFERRKPVHQFKEPSRNDPYRSKSKVSGTPICPVCQSLSIRGRWLSAEQAAARSKANGVPLAATGKLVCPACRQLEQRYALGVVEIHGGSQQQLISRTFRQTERIARIRNDQERILWTKEDRGIAKIYATLPELARRIGRELVKSFHGAIEYEHSTEEPYLRVRWWPDGRRPAVSRSRSKAFRRRSKAA